MPFMINLPKEDHNIGDVVDQIWTLQVLWDTNQGEKAHEEKGSPGTFIDIITGTNRKAMGDAMGG